MPKAYWIVHVTVRDPERYPEYLAAALPAFEKYGANFVVRGGAYEVMEGNERDRNVVIEFRDRATAMACYTVRNIGRRSRSGRNMPMPTSSSSTARREARRRAYCRPSCVAFSTRSKRSSDRIASASWSARPFSTGRASVKNFCCIACASGNEFGSPEGSA